MSSDRNWLEFLSILDATFSDSDSSQNHNIPPEHVKAECSKRIADAQDLFARLAKEDGQKDRSALLALIELEHRARSHSMSTGWYFFHRCMTLFDRMRYTRSGTEDYFDEGAFSSSR